MQLGIAGLPAGVTASCGRILAGSKDGCIILQAAGDAKKSAGNAVVFGTSSVPGADGKPTPNSERRVLQVARPLQEFYNPGGGRNHFPVFHAHRLD